MLTVTQVFGENKGARLSYQQDLAGTELTVATKSAESWHQARQTEPEPDVTTVNVKAADIFWRGTTSTTYGGHTYKPTTQNVLTLSNGAKVYQGWYREDQTWTYWASNDTNYRFVVSIERGEVITRLWRNRKNSRTGRWQGTVINQYNHGDWQRPAAERLATAWVIVGVDAIHSGTYTG